MMRSVEVEIQCSADGHALPHLDPAPGVASANAVAAAAAVDILVFAVTAAAAARCMRDSRIFPPSLPRSVSHPSSRGVLGGFAAGRIEPRQPPSGSPAARALRLLPPRTARLLPARRRCVALLPRRRATTPPGGMRRKLRKRREIERREEGKEMMTRSDVWGPR
uniref:Uncharacterized protein n=1 Tax=Oryza rufipogon TaxID=4529 RepID=A0A0E0PJ56_ORYRU